MSDLRPEVQKFAQAMEDKLKQKDYRGGWEECSIDFLTYRLREEQAELFHALRLYHMFPSEDTRNRVKEECVDVANFSMMISDLVNKMGETNDTTRDASDGKVKISNEMSEEIVAKLMSLGIDPTDGIVNYYAMSTMSLDTPDDVSCNLGSFVNKESIKEDGENLDEG